MKPKIDDTIYVRFKDEIYRQKVYMLGKNSFVHNDVFNRFLIDDFRDELFYEDYGKTWFLSLDEINEDIIEIEDGWYEIKGSD